MKGPFVSDVQPTSNPAVSKITLSVTKRSKKPKFTKRHMWTLIGVLTLLALGLIAYKLSTLPGADALAFRLSFNALPEHMRSRAVHLMVAPLGALLVVFARLTLGLRVLGPFRAVLLAVAFEVTGVLTGLAFFALVIGVIVVLRPIYRRMRIAYFGKASAMLVSVAGCIVLATMLGLALGIHSMEQVAYFPVVVLTLTGEEFASVYRREGPRSALWRGGMTALLGVVIALIASLHAVREALLQYPEIMLLCLAGVFAVGTSFKLRLFQHLNPPVKRKKAKKTAIQDAAKPLVLPETATLANAIK